MIVLAYHDVWQDSLMNAVNTIVRRWQYLVALMRGGEAHTPRGSAEMEDGKLAILCPACPCPGYNMPDDWEKILS
jgi:hypothetical protein